MNQKTKNMWLALLFYWILGAVFVIFGGLENISKIYGITLLIFTSLLIIPALLVSLKVKVPHIFANGWSFIFYFFWLLSLGLSYKLQSWLGIAFVVFFIVLFFILGLIFTLLKTLRSRKNGKYYFTDEEHNKTYEYSSFGKAYKKYLEVTLTEGAIDAVLTAIFSWW